MSSPAPEIPRLNRMVYASGSIAGNLLSRSTALWLVFFFDSKNPILYFRKTVALVITVDKNFIVSGI